MESNRLTKLFIRNLFLRIVIISFLFISCHQKSDVGKFETQLFPFELPEGISRAHYLAYKGMAAAAAPERLKTRKTEI